MTLQYFKEGKLYFDDELAKNAWETGQKLSPLPLSPMPALNITEHTKMFLIELAVPGLSHEDLEINVIDNMLVLRYEGNSNAFESVLTQRQWRQEFRMRPFMRQIPVQPEMVQVDLININSANGIISIRLPKMPALSGKVTPIMPFSSN